MPVRQAKTNRKICRILCGIDSSSKANAGSAQNDSILINKKYYNVTVILSHCPHLLNNLVYI